MQIQVYNTACEAADQVARILTENIGSHQSPVLGLPTGGTPQQVYAKLVSNFRAGGSSWRHVRSFNLDEYVGLGRSDPASYASYMYSHLFRHVDCPAGQWHIPDGLSQDPVAEADLYESAIGDAGGMDVVFMGIGCNGHIGFNEPGTPHNSRCSCVLLENETIRANSRYFSSAEKVPTRAITMGIGTILSSRKLVLLATGADKASAVSLAVEGPISENLPASALQRHGEVTIILDRNAASLLGNGSDRKAEVALPGRTSV